MRESLYSKIIFVVIHSIHCILTANVPLYHHITIPLFVFMTAIWEHFDPSTNDYFLYIILVTVAALCCICSPPFATYFWCKRRKLRRKKKRQNRWNSFRDDITMDVTTKVTKNVSDVVTKAVRDGVTASFSGSWSKSGTVPPNKLSDPHSGHSGGHSHGTHSKSPYHYPSHHNSHHSNQFLHPQYSNSRHLAPNQYHLRPGLPPQPSMDSHSEMYDDPESATMHRRSVVSGSPYKTKSEMIGGAFSLRSNRIMNKSNNRRNGTFSGHVGGGDVEMVPPRHPIHDAIYDSLPQDVEHSNSAPSAVSGNYEDAELDEKEEVLHKTSYKSSYSTPHGPNGTMSNSKKYSFQQPDVIPDDEDEGEVTGGVGGQSGSSTNDMTIIESTDQETVSLKSPVHQEDGHDIHLRDPPDINHRAYGKSVGYSSLTQIENQLMSVQEDVAYPDHDLECDQTVIRKDCKDLHVDVGDDGPRRANMSQLTISYDPSPSSEVIRHGRIASSAIPSLPPDRGILGDKGSIDLFPLVTRKINVDLGDVQSESRTNITNYRDDDHRGLHSLQHIKDHNGYFTVNHQVDEHDAHKLREHGKFENEDDAKLESPHNGDRHHYTIQMNDDSHHDTDTQDSRLYGHQIDHMHDPSTMSTIYGHEVDDSYYKLMAKVMLDQGSSIGGHDITDALKVSAPFNMSHIQNAEASPKKKDSRYEEIQQMNVGQHLSPMVSPSPMRGRGKGKESPILLPVAGRGSKRTHSVSESHRSGNSRNTFQSSENQFTEQKQIEVSTDLMSDIIDESVDDEDVVGIEERDRLGHSDLGSPTRSNLLKHSVDDDDDDDDEDRRARKSVILGDRASQSNDDREDTGDIDEDGFESDPDMKMMQYIRDRVIRPKHHRVKLMSVPSDSQQCESDAELTLQNRYHRTDTMEKSERALSALNEPESLDYNEEWRSPLSTAKQDAISVSEELDLLQQ